MVTKSINSKTNVSSVDFSGQFRKNYDTLQTYWMLDVMRQSAYSVVSPITVNNFASHFNCTPVCRASDSVMTQHKAGYFSWLGWIFSYLLLCHSESNRWFSFAPVLSVVV